MTTSATTGRLLRSRAPRQERELWEQAELFKFLRLWSHVYPQFAWIHSIPNGANLSPVERGKITASGRTAGVWDIFVPIPTFNRSLDVVNSCGLYIEMKDRGRKLTPEQEAYRAFLEPRGYTFRIAYDWIEAAREILNYLGIEDPSLMDHLILNTKGIPAK